MPDPSTLPLVALLGHAHDALERDFDARLRQTEFADLSLAHSRNVLRHLSHDDCCRASQLAERSGISKQALSLQIAQLERAGYVVVQADPSDRRARHVALTARGRSAQRAVGRVLREVDAQWRRTWGEDTWQLLRARLHEIIPTGCPPAPVAPARPDPCDER